MTRGNQRPKERDKLWPSWVHISTIELTTVFSPAGTAHVDIMFVRDRMMTLNVKIGVSWVTTACHMETGACSRCFASQVLALQDQYSVLHSLRVFLLAFFLARARKVVISVHPSDSTVGRCTGCRALKERGSVIWGPNLVPSLRPASPYMYSRD